MRSAFFKRDLNQLHRRTQRFLTTYPAHHPQFEQTKVWHYYSYLRAGDLGKTLAYINDYTERSFNQLPTEFFSIAAIAFRESHQKEKSEYYAQKALEKGAVSASSGMWAYYARLAQNYVYHNQYDEAILALEQSERENLSLSHSVDWVILSNKIDIYFDCGMIDMASAAIPELNKLFLRAQHYDESHQYQILARFYFFQNDFENAEKNFQKALSLSKYPVQKRNALKYYQEFAKSVGNVELQNYLHRL